MDLDALVARLDWAPRLGTAGGVLPGGQVRSSCGRRARPGPRKS
jgi:hypothetical protein